ncbi:MAG: hypothetical protein MJZ41_09670 [Bacteroidaceae bacterium]|nr:hypothetical protein [Bacteroidaceae bacterium]
METLKVKGESEFSGYSTFKEYATMDHSARVNGSLSIYTGNDLEHFQFLENYEDSTPALGVFTKPGFPAPMKLVAKNFSFTGEEMNIEGHAWFQKGLNVIEEASFQNGITAFCGAGPLNVKITSEDNTPVIGFFGRNSYSTGKFVGNGFYFDRHVGIGLDTNSTEWDFEVKGQSRMDKLISEYIHSNGLLCGNYITGDSLKIGDVRLKPSRGWYTLSVQKSESYKPLAFEAKAFSFREGSVAIGVDQAQEGIKLQVAGKILCQGDIEVASIDAEDINTKGIKTDDITVKMNDVADYVFEDNYDLKQLSEVEAYVKENKHLPGIPSASEIEANGVSLSKMTNMLLEKVEELTLHMIQLEKENKELKAQMKELMK